MAIMYTNQKCKKQKKKAGWQKQQAEYEEWLKKVNSMTCFTDGKKALRVEKPIDPIVKGPVVRETPKHKSLGEFVTGGTGKKVVDPRIFYKDDPEMLERELKARERKFATAPAYNKGGAMLVTEEMMKDIASGANRRRN